VKVKYEFSAGEKVEVKALVEYELDKNWKLSVVTKEFPN
jgi:hypothetical protein